MNIAAKTLATVLLFQASFAAASDARKSETDGTTSILEIAEDASVVESSSIPAEVLAAIKASAAKRHANDYSTRLYVIQTEKEAYRKLAALRPPAAVPASAFNRIVQQAGKRHPESYSTCLYVINNQLEAYQDLKNFRPPREVPEAAFKSIVRDAARRHPDDYSTLLYVINQQIEAYQKVQSQ